MASRSSSVFVVECDSENFEKTVLSSTDLREFTDVPGELDGLESARLWGVPNGDSNRTYFEKMKQGDLVLFYRDGEYVGSGWVRVVFEDEANWASSSVWSGKPSQFVFVVEDFEAVSVPMKAVHRIFDYSDSYQPPAFMRVADSRVNRAPEAIKLALRKYESSV